MGRVASHASHLRMTGYKSLHPGYAARYFAGVRAKSTNARSAAGNWRRLG
jgi:hypothetical protein